MAVEKICVNPFDTNIPGNPFCEIPVNICCDFWSVTITEIFFQILKSMFTGILVSNGITNFVKSGQAHSPLAVMTSVLLVSSAFYNGPIVVSQPDYKTR